MDAHKRVARVVFETGTRRPAVAEAAHVAMRPRYLGTVLILGAGEAAKVVQAELMRGARFQRRTAGAGFAHAAVRLRWPLATGSHAEPVAPAARSLDLDRYVGLASIRECRIDAPATDELPRAAGRRGLPQLDDDGDRPWARCARDDRDELRPSGMERHRELIALIGDRLSPLEDLHHHEVGLRRHGEWR